MSANRLKMMTKAAATTVQTASTVASPFVSESMNNRPMPGIEKICSVMISPPNRAPAGQGQHRQHQVTGIVRVDARAVARVQADEIERVLAQPEERLGPDRQELDGQEAEPERGHGDTYE